MIHQVYIFPISPTNKQSEQNTKIKIIQEKNKTRALNFYDHH